MSIYLSEGTPTVRRYPRSLSEAFPDIRAHCHTIPTKPSLLRRVLRFFGWLR